MSAQTALTGLTLFAIFDVCSVVRWWSNPIIRWLFMVLAFYCVCGMLAIAFAHEH